MRIKKSILSILVVLVFSLNYLSAQSNCFYRCDGYDTGKKYYVYSDVANVRTSPDIYSDINFKLTAGHEVILISYKEESVEIDGINGFWLFIKTTDQRCRKGWIWSGTLSCGQLQRGDTKFVFGIENTNEDKCEFSIKAIEKKDIIDRKKIEVYFEIGLDNVAIIDSVCLKNVKYVLCFTMSTYGCNSIGEDEYYFAWLDEKKKLVKLPKTSSFEANKESLYIPTQSNKRISDLLLKVSEEGIQPENNEHPYDYEKWKYKTELFKWTGEKLIKY